jgi:hypothetical protein
MALHPPGAEFPSPGSESLIPAVSRSQSDGPAQVCPVERPPPVAQSTAAARCSVPLRWHKALALRGAASPRWHKALVRRGAASPWWHKALARRGVASPSGVHTSLEPQRRRGWVARHGSFVAQARFRSWRWPTGHCVGPATCDPCVFPVRAENPPQVSGGPKRATYSAPHGACLPTRSGTGRQHAGDRHDEGANPCVAALTVELYLGQRREG